MHVLPASEDVRAQILGCAEDRFSRFGYRKTTMAEIAEDAGMSAANLYRYFESKQDMAAACACRCMGERVERLRAVVREPGLSAVERLRKYVLTNVEHTHEEVTAHQPMHEMVEYVTRERPELVHEKIAAEQGLIAEILALGNESGEFDVDDVLGTAWTVHSTLVLFEVPIFVGLFPRADFEAMAGRVVDLLVRGLRRR